MNANTFRSLKYLQLTIVKIISDPTVHIKYVNNIVLTNYISHTIYNKSLGNKTNYLFKAIYYIYHPIPIPCHHGQRKLTRLWS